MLIITKISLSIFFLIMAYFATAQGAKEELIDILNKFAYSKNYLSVNLCFKYYKHHNMNEKFVDSLIIPVKMQGESFYYSIGDHEYLHNSKYSVIADNGQKVIFLSKISNPKTPLLSLIDLLSLLNDPSVKVKYISSAAYKYFALSFSSGDLDYAELYYDQKGVFLQKAIFWYHERKVYDEIHEPLVEIDYRPMLTKNSSIDNVFSESKFLIQAHGSWIASSFYKNYKVVINNN